MSPPLLGPRFREALLWAAELHETQTRKGQRVPYVSHLLSVCALVLEDGGAEDEAIAALLHDAAEDQGGEKQLAEIENRFGPAVARIVAACSDTFEDPKPAWRPRKEAHLAHLSREAREVPGLLRVVAADKLHNAQCTLLDLESQGEALWSRFNGGRDGSLWYYQAVHHTLREAGGGPLVDRLGRVVRQLTELARPE